MSFSNLKRASSSLTKITKAIEDANNKKFAQDEREWKHSTDKAGNGYAILRFLPASPVDGEESIPWVRIFTHGFKGPGGQWLIENCPTTVNQKCPICEYNSELWNTGEQKNKDQVSKQKRKLVYVVNVCVIKDAAHPEQEGKVFIYKFGKKIFDKISLMMNPTIPDEAAINPFDLWNGADFKLVIKRVGEFANYDDSKFDRPAPLLGGDDEKLEALWKQEYSLKEFVDPKQFKSYEDLEARRVKVLGSAPKKEKAAEPEKKRAEAPAPVTKQADPIPDEADDVDLQTFQSLVEDL